MLEVEVRIIENKYVSKEGEDRVSSEIKFNDLGFNQYITVEKKFNSVMTREIQKKDGTTFTSNKTMVLYLDNEVYVNISQGTVDKWNELPLGKIQVSKVQLEDSTYNTYQYKAV